MAVVKGNDVSAGADTGYNSQGNTASNVSWSHVNVGGAQSQNTGDASADATGVIVVNTQLNGLMN